MKTGLLSETSVFALFQEREHVFLFGKNASQEIWRIEMYGNAMCG